jgi:hypothetical protein
MNRDMKTLILSACLCVAASLIGYFAARTAAGSLWALNLSLGMMAAIMIASGIVSLFLKPPTKALLVTFAAAGPATGACWAASRATMNGWLLIAGCAVLLVSLLILLVRCHDLEDTVPMPTITVVGMLEIMPFVLFL